MKNKQLLCVLFPLLVACTGQRHQQQVSSESIIEEAVRKGEVLKGEIVPIDMYLLIPIFNISLLLESVGKVRVSPFMRRISVLQGRTRCGCLMTARAGCINIAV